MNDPEPVKFAPETVMLVKSGILGAMGGLVRELKIGGPYRFVKFVAGAFIAIFCATVVHYICLWKAPQPITPSYSAMMTAAGGVAGYIGTPLLDFIASRVRKFIRRIFEPETKTKAGE